MIEKLVPLLRTNQKVIAELWRMSGGVEAPPPPPPSVYKMTKQIWKLGINSWKPKTEMESSGKSVIQILISFWNQTSIWIHQLLLGHRNDRNISKIENQSGDIGKGSKGVKELSQLYPMKNQRMTWMTWISVTVVDMELIACQGNATVLKRKMTNDSQRII